MPISFDPNAQAKSTDTLQVEMVRRITDGEVIDVANWLPTKTEGEIHRLRTKIRQKIDGQQFVCFCCGHDVLLRKHEHGGHYFAHKERSTAEKSECIYQQKRLVSLDERNRIRYHGQRESFRHIKTKELIKNILNADSNFSKTVVEKVWTTFSDGWRKPDVATIWGNQPIVFEAQVSNTYPQVVAERTDFYRKQGALLIWIYDRITNEEWRTLHADTFCSNGQNLFFVDDECVATSQGNQQAFFKIYSKYPDVIPFKRASDQRWLLKIIQKEDISIVPFSSLSLDVELQKATYFNLKHREQFAEHKILCAEVQAGSSCDKLEKSIQEIINSSRPIKQITVKGWAALICGIESKRLGQPIGTSFSNPIGSLNLVHDYYPEFFGHLINFLDKLKLDPSNLRVGAWRTRVNDFYNGRYKGGDLPEAHKKSEELLKLIYC